MTITEAIERSQGHNERVQHITYEATSNGDTDHAVSDVLRHAESLYDGEIDWCDANRDESGRRVIDVWGFREDAAPGEMDWRLCVTIQE